MNNKDQLVHIQRICERLPFTRPEPERPNDYAKHLSGDWNDVPTWAIRRLNFLEYLIKSNEKMRCPRMDNDCPRFVNTDEPMSCITVKHCYPYLCDGSCGHNEIWVTDKEKKVLDAYNKRVD